MAYPDIPSREILEILFKNKLRFSLTNNGLYGIHWNDANKNVGRRIYFKTDNLELTLKDILVQLKMSNRSDIILNNAFVDKQDHEVGFTEKYFLIVQGNYNDMSYTSKVDHLFPELPKSSIHPHVITVGTY